MVRHLECCLNRESSKDFGRVQDATSLERCTYPQVSTEAQGHPTNMVFLDLVVHEHLQCGIYDKFLLLLDMPLIPGTIVHSESQLLALSSSRSTSTLNVTDFSAQKTRYNP